MTVSAAAKAKFPWKIFSVVLIGTFLGPIGGLMTGVALPTLSREFEVDLTRTVLVLLTYLATTTFMLPIVGKLGTQFGLKRIYVSGFLIDVVGTVLCATAPLTDIRYLAVFRIIQALGSVMVFALFSALITRYVPEERRGMAFGLTGGMVAISMLIGAPLAGILCQFAGWQWIFWVQVPIQIVGLIVGARVLPTEKRGERQHYNAVSILGWFGITVGFTVLAEVFKGDLSRDLLPLVLGSWLLSLVIFAVAERGRNPLLEYAIFRIRPYWVCAVGLLVNNFIIQVWLIFTTYYLEDYLGYEQMRMSMTLSLSLLATLIAAPLSGRLVDRIGLRKPLIAGLGITLFAMLLMAYAVYSGSVGMLSMAIVMLGLGGGLYNAPALASMMGSVPDHLQAKASSISSLTRNTGFLVGASAGTLLFSALLVYSGPQGSSYAKAMQESLIGPQTVPLHNFSFAFAGLLVFCAILLMGVTLLSFSLPDKAIKISS